MKHNLGGNLGGNKEQSSGTLEIHELSSAEKESFEFWDFHETVHNETQNESIKHNNL